MVQAVVKWSKAMGTGIKKKPRNVLVLISREQRAAKREKMATEVGGGVSDRQRIHPEVGVRGVGGLNLVDGSLVHQVHCHHLTRA